MRLSGSPEHQDKDENWALECKNYVQPRGRLEQVTREMNENKLHISECRWTGFGSQRTQTSETIMTLFSG